MPAGAAAHAARCVRYGLHRRPEGQIVDTKGKQPLFEFGHGLSYTTFAYSSLKAAIDSVCTVRNTGKRAGAEIVEVYAGLPAASQRTAEAAGGVGQSELAAGASKTVTLPLDPKFLSIFDEQKDDWSLLPGE